MPHGALYIICDLLNVVQNGLAKPTDFQNGLVILKNDFLATRKLSLAPDIHLFARKWLSRIFSSPV
jgi:hypothetical protein